MCVVRVRDTHEAGQVTAGMVASARPAHLGVATGESTRSTYRALVARRSLPARTELFLLDEYIGLDMAGEGRFARSILEQLAVPLGLAMHSPDVDAADLDRAAGDFGAMVRASGIDVQLLGIGINGHIAFNEPGTPFDSTCRVVELTTSTRHANAVSFRSPDDVPRWAITLGIGDILAAARIIVVATGAAKTQPVAAMLESVPSPAVPATALRSHDDVTLIADAPALALTQR